MSDEPKPTTGEWTAKRIAEVLGDSAVFNKHTYRDYVRLASEINAELGARIAQAHDDRKHWEARVYGLEQQLAAELEKVENLHKILGQKRTTIKELREQLIAEREKLDNTCKWYQDQLNTCKWYQDQLVAERKKWIGHGGALAGAAVEEIQQLREQLAAERETHAQCEYIRDQLSAEKANNDAQSEAYVCRINELNRQLDAEREKVQTLVDALTVALSDIETSKIRTALSKVAK